MAKIAFTKLGLTKNIETATLDWNGQKITVKKYLPIEQKLDMISDIINQSIDDNNYYNPCRVNLFFVIEVVANYCDVNFTDKQREDVYKLYDLLIGSGFFDAVIGCLDELEVKRIQKSIEQMITNVYDYKNSVYGILDTIKKDYKDMDLDIEGLAKKLTNAENLDVVKDVVTKLD